MTDDMSSKNSNNSDIEVINPEDLEESPPPSDVKEKVEAEVENQKSEDNVEVQKVEENKEEEVVTSVGDSEPPAPASVETIGKVEDVAAAPIPAVNDDDDDPPIEIMREPPAPAPASIEPELDLDLQPAAVVRPVVTSARPNAALEEVEDDDDEEDDDDIDETLAERLVGLTEMFPDFVRKGAVSMVKNSWSLTKWSYSMSRTVTWIMFSSAGILFMPVMIETERLQIQDQQKAQKNQMLFGTGGTGGGAPSIGPPPI